MKNAKIRVYWANKRGVVRHIDIYRSNVKTFRESIIAMGGHIVRYGE